MKNIHQLSLGQIMMTLTKTSEVINVNAKPTSCPLKEEVVYSLTASRYHVYCIMGHALNLSYKTCRILECSFSAQKDFVDTYNVPDPQL